DEGEEEYDEESEEEVYQPAPWRGLDWVSKAQTLNEMERYREAIEQCNEALSINPGNSKALYVKGEAFRGLGNQKRALECYTKAVRSRPNDEEIWYSAGIVLKQMGKLNDALVAFEKATEAGDTHHDAWYEKAVVLRLLGRPEESRTCLEKAFRNYPLNDGEKGRSEPLPAKRHVDSEEVEVDESKTEGEEEKNLESLDSLLGDIMTEPEKDPRTQEEIPFDLVDEKVLLCTLNQSLNIQQITNLVKIPLVRVYKKVRWMEELGLLRRVKVEVVGDPKKRVGYYRTNMKKVKLYSNEGRLRLGIEFMQLIPQTEEKVDPRV
ncbi:MAG: tetratricopeptide repeat protein, partial [Thermoplasmata archaeon]|nr:tetratricopeptide repeat protein [Thermoplasmata archaeon]